MENKNRINSILSDIKELEQLLRDALREEVYPIAFFSRSFDLAHHLLKDLHILEGEQIETLRKQMEEYRRMIDTASVPAENIDFPIIAETVKNRAPEPTAKDNVVERQHTTLNDVISKQNLADLRKALSLNERFYFQKELFAGDEARMNEALAELNETDSYEAALTYVRDKLKWNEGDLVVIEFLNLLEKRFC
ncbi:MAG: hypothetical protein LBH04_01940 [Tannerellaceae bacterium]|jgi:hypothetical protein|nr:hypothetical protein [Tannerellaceae bacterium]